MFFCYTKRSIFFNNGREARRGLQATGELGGATQLLCSPVLRARQTAEAIAPILGLPLCIDDQLIEQDTGEAEGIGLPQSG